MANIDLKSFLRNNGFRHLRDKDRGATWGNGTIEIFVAKSYDGEHAKLRALMDQVRDAAKKKAKMKAADDERMARAEAKAAARPDIPRTPEEHRHAQIEAARLARQEEVAAEVLTPTEPYEVKVERKPEPVAKTDGRRGTKKFKGPERLYVYGRVKAMFQAKMENGAIAAALQAEGITMPNGKKVDASVISQCRWNWAQNPARAEKYAAILMPRRQVPGTPNLAAPRPVVVAPTPPKSEVPR